MTEKPNEPPAGGACLTQPVRRCSCGGNMEPHHRQTYDDCTWLVCSNFNCDATAMVPKAPNAPGAAAATTTSPEITDEQS